jgi:hypothetical protein
MNLATCTLHNRLSKPSIQLLLLPRFQGADSRNRNGLSNQMVRKRTLHPPQILTPTGKRRRSSESPSFQRSHSNSFFWSTVFKGRL